MALAVSDGLLVVNRRVLQQSPLDLRIVEGASFLKRIALIYWPHLYLTTCCERGTLNESMKF